MPRKKQRLREIEQETREVLTKLSDKQALKSIKSDDLFVIDTKGKSNVSGTAATVADAGNTVGLGENSYVQRLLKKIDEKKKKQSKAELDAIKRIQKHMTSSNNKMKDGSGDSEEEDKEKVTLDIKTPFKRHEMTLTSNPSAFNWENEHDVYGFGSKLERLHRKAVKKMPHANIPAIDVSHPATSVNPSKDDFVKGKNLVKKKEMKEKKKNEREKKIKEKVFGNRQNKKSKYEKIVEKESESEEEEEEENENKNNEDKNKKEDKSENDENDNDKKKKDKVSDKAKNKKKKRKGPAQMEKKAVRIAKAVKRIEKVSKIVAKIEKKRDEAQEERKKRKREKEIKDALAPKLNGKRIRIETYEPIPEEVEAIPGKMRRITKASKLDLFRERVMSLHKRNRMDAGRLMKLKKKFARKKVIDKNRTFDVDKHEKAEVPSWNKTRYF